MLIHATTVAYRNQAVLIRGAPGSGKSTLALELIESCGTGLGTTLLKAKLVADDQTFLEVMDGKLFGRAPETLRGKLEVRGLGIIDVADCVASARVILVVDLDPAAERFPANNPTAEILGHNLPRVAFPPHAGTLSARVRVAFAHLNSAVAGRVAEA